MAKKVSASISKRLSKHVAKHKGDETNYGIVNLPGGINNGIARLNDCKFDTYKSGTYKGEYYFLANGIVISPDSTSTGIPVKGLRTQIMVPLCDTKKANGKVASEEDHVANMLNELRKLGLDTSEMEDDELEEALEELKEAAPYFRFSTSQAEPTEEQPNPRVWENWHGVRGLEEYDPDDESDEVEEDVEEEEVEETPKKKAAPKKASAKKTKEPEPEPEDEEEESEEDTDLVSLAEAADSGDEDAAARLTELCDKAEVDPNEYETWVEVVEVLEPSEEADDDEEEEEPEEEEEEVGEEEEEEEIEPEKEEVYYYKPPKKRKKVEVEVTAVFKAKKTCNLKDLEEDGKVYKGVSWTDLSTEAD